MRPGSKCRHPNVGLIHSCDLLVAAQRDECLLLDLSILNIFPFSLSSRLFKVEEPTSLQKREREKSVGKTSLCSEWPFMRMWHSALTLAPILSGSVHRSDFAHNIFTPTYSTIVYCISTYLGLVASCMTKKEWYGTLCAASIELSAFFIEFQHCFKHQVVYFN